MKKIFVVATLLMLVSAFLTPSAKACTNYLITRGASTDGSNMITYAADSHVLYGELYFRPAADWQEGKLIVVLEFVN